MSYCPCCLQRQENTTCNRCAIGIYCGGCGFKVECGCGLRYRHSCYFIVTATATEMQVEMTKLTARGLP